VERSSGAAPPLQPGGSGSENAAPLLAVRIEDSENGASIVTLSGELDLSTIRRVEAALLEQIHQRRAVLVDLSGVSFIDSSGIGVLIRASRESHGTPMHLVIGPGSHVERIFGIAGIGEALTVFSSREQALAALAGRLDANAGPPE
jgi:stage II sporulation protein AA (anti-sigma F factor antagonist)